MTEIKRRRVRNAEGELEQKPVVAETDFLEEVKAIKKASEPQIDEMPLETLGDYCRYNEAARKVNKRLRLCRYRIKPCPAELHPQEKVIIERKDGSSGPIPIYLSNDMIDYNNKITPGVVYEMPRCVVEYIAGKSSPEWGMVDKKDGSKTCVKVRNNPRFAVRTVYA